MNENDKNSQYNTDSSPQEESFGSNEAVQNLNDLNTPESVQKTETTKTDSGIASETSSESVQEQNIKNFTNPNYPPYGDFPNNGGYYGYNPNFVYIPNQKQGNFNYGSFNGYANPSGNYNPYNYNPFQAQYIDPQKQFTNQEDINTNSDENAVDNSNNSKVEDSTSENSTPPVTDKSTSTKKKKSFTRSIWFTVAVSVLSSVLTLCILFVLVAYFPSKDKSLLASFYSNSKTEISGQTNNPSGTDVTLEGETIKKGDDVTINIEGKSAIAQAVYAKAVNSVVGISVSQITGNKWDQTETIVSMGSGVVYSSDGLIITNHHVIEAALDASGKKSSSFNIQIYFDTELTEWTYVTEIVGYDAENDIAVLRADAKNLQPIEFADSDTLTTGETAISLGSPGGLSYMNSISEGILSGLNRTINTGTSVIYDLIQTTAAINPGNSGGALLNSEGKLIGICVIKIAATNYESMGFAINSNTVKTIVESILEYGYYNKPLLGVTVNTTYTSTIAKKQGWESGAYIEDVSPNSAAAKAGIKSGDIITKLEDTKINSFAELRRFLLDCKPGDSVKVTLFNSDSKETRTVSVTLSGTEK